MELWEIAAVLYPDGDDDPEPELDGRAMLAARVKAAETGQAVPEWGPLTRTERAEWEAHFATAKPLGPPGRSS